MKCNAVLPRSVSSKNPINIYATDVVGIYDVAYWGVEQKDGKDFVKVHVENMKSGLGELYVNLITMEILDIIKMPEEEVNFIISWLEANKNFIIQLAKRSG